MCLLNSTLSGSSAAPLARTVAKKVRVNMRYFKAGGGAEIGGTDDQQCRKSPESRHVIYNSFCVSSCFSERRRGYRLVLAAAWRSVSFSRSRSVGPGRSGKQAAQLLALSELSIDQIASDCGFPNRYYFSRVFRQHQGRRPAEYQHRQVR